ncbi:hypothetical protein BH20ACI3_BH20ACI3_33140 [soil metagenome]
MPIAAWIFNPQRIVISTYNRGRTGADKVPELLLGGKVTFAYGAFTRFDVDTPDASSGSRSTPYGRGY